jgi:integrase
MRKYRSAKELAKCTSPGRYAVGQNVYLQVSKWHTRSWVFRYIRDGVARHMGLGPYDLLSLAEARERGHALRRQLLDGVDPLEAKRAAKLERHRADARAKTFEQVAREYIDAHETTWRGDGSRRQWTASLEQHAFKKIGHISVADITVTDVLAALDPIARKIPETAGRVRHRIAKILDWAHARDLRGNDNPARRPNLLPKRPKQSRQHFAAMAYTALPAFMHELGQRTGMIARALELLILTATRPAEIRGARWSEIDLASAMWTLPGERMKSGRPHRIPLSGRAVELLAALPREGEYIFLGRAAGVRSNPHGLRRLLHRMGHSVTAHGFRAAFKTWASEQTAYPRELIEVALAHSLGALDEAYRRADMMERRRRLMEDWAEYCSRPHIEGDVVPLRSEVRA